MTRVEELKARIAERRASMDYEIALRREGSKPRPRKPPRPRPRPAREPRPPKPTPQDAKDAAAQALAAIGLIARLPARRRRTLLRRIEEAAFEASR